MDACRSHTRRVLLTLAAFAFLVVTFVFAAQPLGATMVCPDGQGQAAANACGDALQANVELMEFAGAGLLLLSLPIVAAVIVIVMLRKPTRAKPRSTYGHCWSTLSAAPEIREAIQFKRRRQNDE